MYSKDAASTRFWIVPERLGQIPIEVSAVSGAAGDAVRRLLLVEVSKSRAVSGSTKCRAGKRVFLYKNSFF